MRRCLELASRGAGMVSPNPMVGALLVHNGKVIGEGWHQQYGGAHAEVEAVRAVSNPELLKESTLYVSLEPCSHFGKTPPCVDLILQSGIPVVVVASLDPNPKVAGAGIARLQAAGVSVTIGVLEQEARALNRGFFSFHERGRPWIVLKWAQTADGFIAPADGKRVDISSAQSRALVHQWRAVEDCVLVGTRTAIVDDPELTVRLTKGRNPLRAVLDRELALPKTLKLFDRATPTLVINSLKSCDDGAIRYRKLNSTVPLAHGIIELLVAERVQSVIVEGGASLLQSFIASGLWDEARIFSGAVSFGAGLSAPKVTGSIVSDQSISGDELVVIVNRAPYC